MITQRHRKAKLYVKESAEVLWESHTLGMHKWTEVISSIMAKVEMANLKIFCYFILNLFIQNQFTDVYHYKNWLPETIKIGTMI